MNDADFEMVTEFRRLTRKIIEKLGANDAYPETYYVNIGNLRLYRASNAAGVPPYFTLLVMEGETIIFRENSKELQADMKVLDDLWRLKSMRQALPQMRTSIVLDRLADA